MKLAITKYGYLNHQSFSINGNVQVSCPDGMSPVEFTTHLYRENKVSYPKYFKMDHLSRLGFLMADLLLKDTALYGDHPKLQTGIFLNNHSASLDTDQDYQDTLGAEYFPSPAVFVYTLPNIVMGEIAIKHKIYGENTFFVSETFDIQSLFDYVYQSFNQTKMENALVGWVEYYKGNMEAFMMLVSKDMHQTRDTNFTVETITNLYKSNKIE